MGTKKEHTKKISKVKKYFSKTQVNDQGSSGFEVDTGMKYALIESIILIAPLSINPKHMNHG